MRLAILALLLLGGQLASQWHSHDASLHNPDSTCQICLHAPSTTPGPLTQSPATTPRFVPGEPVVSILPTLVSRNSHQRPQGRAPPRLS